jgi:hypothetical protein
MINIITFLLFLLLVVGFIYYRKKNAIRSRYRYPMEVPVNASYMDSTVPLTLINISTTGLGIKGVPPFALKKNFNIDMNNKTYPVSLVYTEKDKFGVKFEKPLSNPELMNFLVTEFTELD